MVALRLEPTETYYLNILLILLHLLALIALLKKHLIFLAATAHTCDFIIIIGGGGDATAAADVAANKSHSRKKTNPK